MRGIRLSFRDVSMQLTCCLAWVPAAACRVSTGPPCEHVEGLTIEGLWCAYEAERVVKQRSFRGGGTGAAILSPSHRTIEHLSGQRSW